MMRKTVVAGVSGLLFGVGVAYAGLAEPAVIFSFLQLDNLNLIILTLVFFAVIVFSHNILPGLIKSPFFFGEFTTPVQTTTIRVIVGALLFGIGWGLAGLGLSTSLIALGSGALKVLYVLAGIFVGVFLSVGFYKRAE